MAALLLALILIAAGVGVASLAGSGGIWLGPLPLTGAAALLAFAIQWVAFVPAFLKRTERFYDLTGSLTYLSVVGLVLFGAQPEGPRPWVLAALVGIWAIRLGSFLFRRVHRAGKDGRFDEIKQSAPRFLMAWTLQGLWVTLTALAALTLIGAGNRSALGVADLGGYALWVLGFGIEVVADRQKSAFNGNPANAGRFVCTGLWAWSRHPNYLGEILLWTGVFLSGAGIWQGWQWLSLLSPLFVVLLLTRVSGIPLLEKRADEKWGGQADYEAYKARTPVLLLRRPS